MPRPATKSQKYETKDTSGQKTKAEELDQEDMKILQSIRNSWRQTVESLYPKLHSYAHFLPPVYFHHERFQQTTFAGQHILIDQQQTSADLDAGYNQPAFPVPELPQPSGLFCPDGKPALTDALSTSLCRRNAAYLDMSKQGKGASRCTDACRADLGLTESSLAGRSVLWPSQPDAVVPQRSVQESTLREDFAQQHVLYCLQALAERQEEVMFVISQLKFSDYLNHPCYAATTALFPQFSDIQHRYRDGDFDVLVIHRRCGILVGEIKSVGLNTKDACAEKSHQDLQDDLAKRVEKAVWQLNKSEDVLNFLLHDLSPSPVVHKTLILPYIFSAQLRDALEKHDHLKTTLCQCLEANTVEDAVQLCLCSDQMSGRATPWEVTDNVMSRLSQWWQQRMTCHHDYSMTEDIYADIVARFCGPATTVRVHSPSSPLLEIRSESHGVSEVGNRLRKLVLTPEQISLLVEAPPRVFLTGPSGTGKTVLLVLMALQWLQQGYDVHVVCSWPLGLAASFLVHHQLQATMQACQISLPVPGRIHFHRYDFQEGETEVAKSIADLLSLAKNQSLHIVMDEVYLDPNNAGIDAAPLAKLYNQFVEELLAKTRGLHLWMAGAMHNCIPHGLDAKPLLVPLRCVPVVQRMLTNTVDLEILHVHSYANRIYLPCDGPRIIKLTHAGDGHDGKWPLECCQCGREIADVLLRHLQIGSRKPVSETEVAAHTNTCRKCSIFTSPLQFRDVFVLTHGHLHDQEIACTDNKEQLKSNTNRLTHGLRDAGVPVHVVRDYRDHGMAIWEKDLQEVILGKEDKVTLAEWNDVLGLERKVVIYVPGRKDDPDKQFTNEILEIWGKINSLSRCIAQLIIVHIPADDAHLSCK